MCAVLLRIFMFIILSTGNLLLSSHFVKTKGSGLETCNSKLLFDR
jgi:hypothetical protein